MTQDSSKTHIFKEYLQQAHGGDKNALDWLIKEVYDELKMLASVQRRNRDESLQTTALVNEAWLKLAHHGMEYSDRGHFLAVAATAMRQILVDEARLAMRVKRGGDQFRVTYQTTPGQDFDVTVLLQLDDGLQWLEGQSKRMLDVFQMRYFIGLNDPEVAEALNVSERTVRRDWVKARALLSSRF